MERMRDGTAGTASATPGPRGARLALALGLLYALLALAVYRPALGGAFISDDRMYLPENPWVQALTVENLQVLLDPAGPPARETQNWAPLHLLVHALEWRAFGPEVFGYHVVDVLLHAGVAALLTLLLEGSGVPRLAALGGGLFFLLHPANVEAVAWISQLKTTLAMLLCLAALLSCRRRPLLAGLLFAAALLTKPTAAFALPVAVLLCWTRAGGERASRRAWLGLAAWAVLLGVYTAIQLPLLAGNRFVVPPLHPEAAVRLRSLFAFWMRYLAMAATGYGVSAFQEPPPALSPLDPWWLGGLGATLVLGTRTLQTAWARRPEAAWWIWAAAGFAPVSQLVPFLYPMADRYLYFILPGLVGGVLLWAGSLLHDLDGASRGSRRATLASRGLALALLPLLVLFALRSHERARLWRAPAWVKADAAAHTPDGLVAHVLRAEAAGRRGDAPAAVRELRAAALRGFDRYDQLLAAPAYAPVRRDPEFQAVVRELARRWAEQEPHLVHPTQRELRGLAQAHLVLGEYEDAERLLQRALEAGGPESAAVRGELAVTRAARERAAGDAGGGATGVTP